MRKTLEEAGKSVSKAFWSHAMSYHKGLNQGGNKSGWRRGKDRFKDILKTRIYRSL